MKESGRVKAIKGNQAMVAFIKKSGCGGNCGSCGGGCPKDTLILEIENTQDAKVGDEVTVELSNKHFSKMLVWAYVIPGLMLFLGLIGTYIISKNELIALIVGVTLMVLSYVIIGKFNNKDEKEYDFKMINKK
ncbi:positive regulator of sigma(E), RseC/MucC [Clostridium collagenovorans DSM 3089]|uniref:Positive regulator of sigma(E), RseC/MucC n=1 Tax=Clostridium collagenovorans DSM 3089 TaxID=1121306 RepID=A0A1M5TK39_9CLOT|nr:SoxR reducing system RseC family protein [Clostridium collagenovorans]SHH51030.1 positive regulator of sigma(E), RseC/MucC [Clostridium collagenovorans DSM 3089]